MNKEAYDLILVGTGFASSFFLLKYLEKRKTARVLVLERGSHDTHRWRIDNRFLMDPSGVVSSTDFNKTYVNVTPRKPWIYTPGLGGSSNCWWACAPRLMPNDFKLKTTYDVGTDWPIGYSDLEPYYCDVEDIMKISGHPSDNAFPMSRPYPNPPHRFNDVDKLLKKKYPSQFFHMPTARASRATKNRPRCCASGVCNLCPVDSKFTILNELSHLYEDERVALRLNAQAVGLSIENDTAKDVRYIHNSTEHRATGELIALGANAIFNAHILLASGLSHEMLGRNLSEQVAISCTVLLDGVNNYSGSTALTGHGYMLYDGDHRREHAACLIETFNIPRVRAERHRWTQEAVLKFIYDDIPAARNRVTLSDDPTKPRVEFHGHSDYVDRAIANTQRRFDRLFGCLPIQSVEFTPDVHATECHILGTARMGNDRTTSVVDRHQILHGVRNVLALGGSSFCSISPANPTLTIAALSLWSADKVL